MTVLLFKTRKAKKRHRCDWCPEFIEPGENYIDERAVYCGDFQHLKFHPECKQACSQIAKQNGGDFDIDIRGYKRGKVELKK